MTFASALSEHPDPAEATGEVIGAVLEQLGTEPDVAAVFASPQHRDTFGDMTAAISRMLRPGVLVGTTAVAVLGGSREVEDAPAIGLWAGRLAARPRPVRLDATRTASGSALQGLSASTFEPGDALLLLADPFSLPVDAIIDALAELEMPEASGTLSVPVVGGMASAANTPGGNRLVLDDEVRSSGGVGVVLPGGVATRTVVSQGCRPIGDP
ncbi:MAG TPA: FIST N-terminal domain-containing protein, partial [Acidimicrobiales bacterium]